MNESSRPPKGQSRRRSEEQPPPPPWRTEGLPDRTEPDGPRWGRIVLWVVLGWFLLFGLTTFQDVSSARLTTISYTEFREQVVQGNVERIYTRGDSSEGVLSALAPVAGGAGTLQVFEAGGCTVAA